MDIPKEDLAYMAGFFDGEGYISFFKVRGEDSVESGITQTIMEPLLLFAKYFDGNIHKGRVTRGGLQIYRFRTSSKENIGVLLSSLFPYLIVKKSKAMLALKFIGNEIPQESADEKFLIPYMAGFFDAEGSISVRVRKEGKKVKVYGNKLQPLIVMQQTCIEPLLLFKKTFDGYLYEKGSKTQKGSPIFYYRLNLSQIPRFFELLGKYLIVKRQHAELVFRLQQIKLKHNGKDPKIHEKWDIAKQIIDLNSKKGNKENCKILQLIN